MTFSDGSFQSSPLRKKLNSPQGEILSRLETLSYCIEQYWQLLCTFELSKISKIMPTTSITGQTHTGTNLILVRIGLSSSMVPFASLVAPDFAAKHFADIFNKQHAYKKLEAEIKQKLRKI